MANKAVEPLRSRRDIELLKKVTYPSPRNHLLFVMGINNGLRISDLLALRAGDVRGLKKGQVLHIREQKTGKPNVLMANKAVAKALDRYFREVKPSEEDYLFKSRTGQNRPLDKRSVHRLINKWAGEAGIRGHFGTHTLRKTFGYIQRLHYGVGFELLCKRFNHASPAVTMRYLGIEHEEVNEILANEI